MNASVHYHRPFQSSNAPKSEGKEGRTLLDLLRSRDKLITGRQKASSSADEERQQYDNDNDDGDCQREIAQLEHELLSRLNSLNASIRRCGLFQSSVDRAQSYYSHASERSSTSLAASSSSVNNADNGGTGGSSSSSSAKKRKRKNGGVGGGGSGNSSAGTGLSAVSYGIYLESHSNNDTASFSGMSGESRCDLDEGLVLTVICRILGVTVGRKKKDNVASDASKSRSGKSCELLFAALNILSSLCDHAKDGLVSSFVGKSTLCASMEGDMVGSIGSPLLEALRDNILYLYYKHNEGVNMMEGMMGCFKACASVVALLETKLSRADKTVQSLREATWLVLNNLNGSSDGHEELRCVQKAATALLATLALVGSFEGTPPSKIWSRCVANGITLLHWAIHDFFPISTADSSIPNLTKDGAKADPKLWEEHATWLSVAKELAAMDTDEMDLGNDPVDNHRSEALKSRIQCLTGYVHSLLKMDSYSLQTRLTPLLLPLDSLLDTSEILLSFPLAAEATHRSTKSRLRSSPVKDGLISPNAAVVISADILLCGHALLDVTVQSCSGGGALLLGKARRLVGMVVANLQSSCSPALVSVVVENGRRSSGGGATSAGSWLRGSIPLRIQSVRMFHLVAISLGSGVMSSTGTAKLMSRALVLLGGCLLEQVAGRGEEGGDEKGLSGVDDGEWGTLGERAMLVETTSIALASCIAAFGGLIPNDVRRTLDSITHTCLSTLYSCGGMSIFAYSHVKRSILQLGMNSVCVPWGDGGRGTLTEIVCTVSTVLRNDSDLAVASMALSTLCTLDAFLTPRASPILMPTRGSVDEAISNINGSGGDTASAMLQGMAKSKMEMMDSKNAKEDRVRAKKKAEKSNKKAKKKDETKTNAPLLNSNGEELYAAKRPKVAKETTTAKGPPPAESMSEIGKAVGHPDDNADSLNRKNNKSTADAVINMVSAVEPPLNGKDNISGEKMVAESTTTGGHHQDENSGEESDDDDVEMQVKEGSDDSEGDANDDDDDDDDNSLDDFPDIVDVDADEEDRV